MNRRSFLQRIGAAAIGLPLARHLPGIAPDAPKLAIDPEAWELATGSHLALGDVFTIEGWHTINPSTGRKTLTLQKFMVTGYVAGA